jgi:hypothetical protein
MLYNETIERCKAQIVHRARIAGMKFFQDDIVCTQESDGSNVIFLRRYFVDYETDENDELILDENLKPTPVFRPTAWLEHCENQVLLSNLAPSGTFELSMPIYRVIVPYPWLFFIVKDGKVTDSEAKHA